MPQCISLTSSGKPCRNHAKMNNVLCYSHDKKPRNQYYKFIGNNQGNYPYKLGLNTLADNNETFNADQQCGPGGLYFTDKYSILEFLSFGDTLCIVTIPDGAQVVQIGEKCKTDQMVIESMHDFWTVETWKMLILSGVVFATTHDFMMGAARRKKFELHKFWHENIRPLWPEYIKQGLIEARSCGNKDITDFFESLS